MCKNLLSLTFDILSLHSNLNWSDTYLSFFEKACRANKKELAKQIFYLITLESVRTNDRWMIDVLCEDEKIALEGLGLYDFALKLLKESPPIGQSRIRRKKKWRCSLSPGNVFRYKVRSSVTLCDCCHQYVLTCEEIQNFPLINEESYIYEKFELAFTQNERNKRLYLLERLVCEYAETDGKPDLFLLFDLWERAERAGAHFEVSCLAGIAGESILSSFYFEKFLSIVSVRHSEHDDMIQDVMALLFENGQFARAFYLGAKLSSDKKRLEVAIYLVLTARPDENKNKQAVLFLKNTYASVIHNIDNGCRKIPQCKKIINKFHLRKVSL